MLTERKVMKRSQKIAQFAVIPAGVVVHAAGPRVPGQAAVYNGPLEISPEQLLPGQDGQPEEGLQQRRQQRGRCRSCDKCCCCCARGRGKRTLVREEGPDRGPAAESPTEQRQFNVRLPQRGAAAAAAPAEAAAASVCHQHRS